MEGSILTGIFFCILCFIAKKQTELIACPNHIEEREMVFFGLLLTRVPAPHPFATSVHLFEKCHGVFADDNFHHTKREIVPSSVSNFGKMLYSLYVQVFSDSGPQNHQ